ncbi:MAG TPA: type III-B CRISPR module RAMP protein Cmr1, partial [Dehalococcoidia bacterium]|nr:type III-B CRISPR module RAMP protein Cmr1 [Dehalococcoidia bacterium]
MKEWKLKALTHIWTGDADGKSGCLIPTGIVGSLRWWFEVLVRGLGGKACDPTSDVRCPDQNGRHCVVCELFGCTGWARKFRLMILDDNGQVIRNQIQAGQTFILRFIPLRPIRDEEWCLLDATLRLIADYGAMGGKTVFKPSEEPNRQNALHHQDFGLVQYVQGPDDWQCNKTLDE